MAIYDWPGNLAPRGVGFQQRGMTVAGPRSITGRTQIASVDAGYWIAQYQAVPVGGSSGVKTYRSLRALLEGGAHQIRVPVKDRHQAPWVDGVVVTTWDDVPFNDTALFDDGSGFAQFSIAVVVATAAAARTTQLVVTVQDADDIVGGEYFSIADRLYVIKQVVAESGSQLTLAIWPPLREAAAVGDALNFDRPVCRMRLADETAADLMLERGIYGFPDMAFVEVF